jgi:hypothetical protein
MKDEDGPAAIDRGRAGFTVIEVVFATLITLVVAGVTARAILSLQDCLLEATVRATMLESSVRLLDRLVSELRDADPASVVLAPATDAHSITFSTVEGWNGSERVLGAPRTIRFDAGTVFLDGTPIAALVDDIRFNLDASLLTIDVEIRRTTESFGGSGTVFRQLSSQLHL